MAYKDIVVHLGKDNRSAARLNAAIQLAVGKGFQRHEGRVTGVYVLSRRNIPGSIRCEFPPQILKRLDTGERRLAEEAEERFTERTARTAVRNEWRLMAGDLADAIVTSAHYADIVIVGQTDPKDDDSLGGLADSAVLGAGGPVLIWPYAGEFDVNAATIMLAWNGTREAKHALDGALPLMQQARKVIVFGVDMDDGMHMAPTCRGTGRRHRRALGSAWRQRGGPAHADRVWHRHRRCPALRDRRLRHRPSRHGRLRS